MTLVITPGYSWVNGEENTISATKLNATATTTITLAQGTLAGRLSGTGTGVLVEVPLGVGLTWDGHSPFGLVFDTTPNYIFSGTVSFSTSVKSAVYNAADGSPGISTTITTGSLAGKTITVKNGLITSFV